MIAKPLKQIIMKTNNQSSIHSFECQSLSSKELEIIEGGGFWGDLFYTVGVTFRCFYEFAKTAGEYQASLPPSLKK
jgi:hypothetical protein